MNVIISQTPTTVVLKSYLEQLTKNFHELNTQLETAYRTANRRYKEGSASNVYSEEHLQELLRSETEQASSSFKAQADTLNGKANRYVSELKKQIISALSEFNKPADYAVRIGNALQFIKAEGTEIDDATASQILHDFERDTKTMQRFRSVIEHQKGEKLSDAYGRTTFPLTFGWLEKCEQLLEAFAELEATTAHLFVGRKAETETEYTPSGVKLAVPMDGYSQLIGERNAAEQAETLETMIGELFTTTD